MENKKNHIGLLIAVLLLSCVNTVSLNQLNDNTNEFIVRPVKILISKRKAESKRKNAEVKSKLHDERVATINKYAAYQSERLALEKARITKPMLSNKVISIMDKSKAKDFYINTESNGVDKSGVIPYGR